MNNAAIYTFTVISFIAVLYANFLWRRGFANYLEQCAKKQLERAQRNFQFRGGVSTINGYHRLTPEEKETVAFIMKFVIFTMTTSATAKKIKKILHKTSTIQVHALIKDLKVPPEVDMGGVMYFIQESFLAIHQNTTQDSDLDPVLRYYANEEVTGWLVTIGIFIPIMTKSQLAR